MMLTKLTEGFDSASPLLDLQLIIVGSPRTTLTV